MAAKRILLIGMLDSIHVGRWMSQFEGTDNNFVLYPSKKFRRINPSILKLLSKNSKLDAQLYNKWVPKSVFGYFDFAFKVLPLRAKLNLRSLSLRRLLMENDFDYIHALEIQGAGYLLAESLLGLQDLIGKTIITNYGSDIYYFEQNPEHKAKIESVLQIADYYSAECLRDYKLARELGFIGTDLPCIPNAGGFEVSESIGTRTSDRRQIIVKCYGGQFGRGGLTLQALNDVLVTFSSYRVLLYSVTDDLLRDAQVLSEKFPNRIRIASQTKPIPHDELIKEFAGSRVYVGASVSDGISTSFLEAIVQGAFPIQTNTSCANEWIERGAFGFITSLSAGEIENKIRTALEDDDLVNQAQVSNRLFAEKALDSISLKNIALDFYKTN